MLLFSSFFLEYKFTSHLCYFVFIPNLPFLLNSLNEKKNNTKTFIRYRLDFPRFFRRYNFLFHLYVCLCWQVFFVQWNYIFHTCAFLYHIFHITYLVVVAVAVVFFSVLFFLLTHTLYTTFAPVTIHNTCGMHLFIQIHTTYNIQHTEHKIIFRLLVLLCVVFFCFAPPPSPLFFWLLYPFCVCMLFGNAQ